MPDFPEATEFGKKIPKQKFYEHADAPGSVRRMFVDEIDSIVWRNKFSADTLNIATGQKVSEIELLHITLRQKSLSAAVLGIIAKTIPYLYSCWNLLETSSCGYRIGWIMAI